MAGFWKRLFTLGAAEANSALDSLEDPVKITEQLIREMKDQIVNSTQAAAQSRAAIIRLKTNKATFDKQAESYIEKANKIKDKMDKGSVDEVKGKEFLLKALNSAKLAKNEAKGLGSQLETLEKNDKKVTDSITAFKNEIQQAENNLISLRAQAETAKASKDISKHMSSVNVNGFKSQLDKMKDKVASDQAEAEAYAQLEDAGKSTDEEINDFLNGDASEEDADLLAEFEKGRA